MATYYYEGAKIVAPFSITSNEPMFEADTVSLKKHRASQGAQRWEMSFEVSPNENDNIADSFVSAIDDFHLPSSMVMPQLTKVLSRFTLSGGLATNDQSYAGDKTVRLNNDHGQSGLIPKGYFLKFNNHDKIYLVTEDVSLNGTVNKDLKIFPALTNNVSPQTAVKVGQDAKLVYLKDMNNLRGITFVDGVLTSMGTVVLVEAV